MACVVTEICIDCKHTNCVDVCPVDAFYEGDNQLVISLEECVSCGRCIGECPVDAIVYEDFASIEDIEFNEKYSKLWNNITTSKGNN